MELPLLQSAERVRKVILTGYYAVSEDADVGKGVQFFHV